jgi:hypothetical protein
MTDHPHHLLKFKQKGMAVAYDYYKTIMTYDIDFVVLLMCFKISIEL